MTPGQASDAAVKAAAYIVEDGRRYTAERRLGDAKYRRIYTADEAAHVLAAAHDLALGDQRSVCLADVLAFLRDDTTTRPIEWLCVAEAIAREFGGRDESG